ncbi:MAG: uroporphyrinogen-III synthase [Chlamydiota bacterium]
MKSQHPKALYLGTNTNYQHPDYDVDHCPIIKISPHDPDEQHLQEAFNEFHLYSHVIFTSKNAAKICCDFLPYYDLTLEDLQAKSIITIGKVTAKQLKKYGIKNIHIPSATNAESIILVLKQMSLDNPYIFWPHSAQARPVIADYLIQNNIRHKTVNLYDTIYHTPDPFPNLNDYEALIFSSAPTVEGFLKLFGTIPKDKHLIALGISTQQRLNLRLQPNL